MKSAPAIDRFSRCKMLTGMTFGAAALMTPWAAPALTATPVASPTSGISADDVIAMVDVAMVQQHLKAAIVRVLIDGEEWVTIARGESMGGVPATPETHFRNGAIAITYMATGLLILADRGVVSQDDPLSTWLPDLRDADNATLRMLAN
jgi:CubicO group peptidase (beta-lactamase class C family)